MPTQIVATRLNGETSWPWSRRSRSPLLALLALWLFRGGRDRGAGGGRKGAAPARGAVPDPAALRPALAAARWGLAAAAPPASCHAGAGFLRAGRHLDHRADPPGLHLRQLPHPAGGPGAGPPAGQQPLARDGGDGGRGGVAVLAGVSGGAPAGPRRAGHRGAAGAAVGGARDRVRHRAGDDVQRARAVGGPIRAGGTVWILPLAYLVRNLPITSRAILAGFRALDPSLDEAAASLGADAGARCGG